MRSRVAELLKPIVEAINEHDKVAEDLWDILCALRGPDEAAPIGVDVKEQTTSRLRYAVGFRPQSSEVGVTYMMDGKASLNDAPLMSDGDSYILQKESKFGAHFFSHYRMAVEALTRGDE